jgi:hypothetical protein
LNNGLIDRSPSVESGPAARHAVAAEHSGLHTLPVREADDERDDPVHRKVGARDLLLGLVQDCTLLKLHAPQVRPKKVAVASRQGRQKMVGELVRSDIALPFRHEARRERYRVSQPPTPNDRCR